MKLKHEDLTLDELLALPHGTPGAYREYNLRKRNRRYSKFDISFNTHPDRHNPERANSCYHIDLNKILEDMAEITYGEKYSERERELVFAALGLTI